MHAAQTLGLATVVTILMCVTSAHAKEAVLDTTEIVINRFEDVPKGSYIQGCVSEIELEPKSPIIKEQKTKYVELFDSKNKMKITLSVEEPAETLAIGDCRVFQLSTQLRFVSFGGSFSGFAYADLTSISHDASLVQTTLSPSATLGPTQLPIQDIFQQGVPVGGSFIEAIGVLSSIVEGHMPPSVALTMSAPDGCQLYAYYHLRDLENNPEQFELIGDLTVGQTIVVKGTIDVATKCQIVLTVAKVEKVGE